MNNSFISLDEEEAPEEVENREAWLIKVIEALQTVSKTKEWETLRKEVFENLTHTFENRLTSEAKRENPDSCKLNRLAGQLMWAEKYADLDKYARTLKLELQSIKQRKYGNE